MNKIQEIKERYEVGYTMARYGTKEAIHDQMNKDIAELLKQVKNIAYEPMLAVVPSGKEWKNYMISPSILHDPKRATAYEAGFKDCVIETKKRISKLNNR